MTPTTLDKQSVGVDIETTGLNPWEDKVITMAMCSEDESDVAFDDVDDERRLLMQIEEYMRQTPIDRLVGWNISEFDLPFLAVRFVLNGVDLAPFLTPSGLTGKYGKPRYTGMWYGAVYRDIAYDYEAQARGANVPWSLKPVAKSLGFDPIPSPYDEGRAVAELDRSERERYCISDARTALRLYQRLPAETKGLAVKLKESVTYL